MLDNGARRTPRERIDSEALAALDAYLSLVGPSGFASIATVEGRRAKLAELSAAAPVDASAQSAVLAEDLIIPGPAEAPDVAVRLYRPAGGQHDQAALLFVHGGGMVMGNLETSDAEARALTEAIGCQVLSVEYRLAPEHPHPALVEDCFAALTWLAGASEELGIDERLIGLYGVSAGGGLAAATALMTRDRGGPALAFQALIYPMLDDRSEQPSTHEIVDVGVWDRGDNVEAWQWVLGEDFGTEDVSPYAAPARATDLSGLPPAYVDVGEVDLFRDEAIDYAARLLRAGVATELHVIPGAYHSAEALAAGTPFADRIVERRTIALRRALGIIA